MRQWAEPRGLQALWCAPSNAAQGHEGDTPTALEEVRRLDLEIQPWVDAIKPAGDLWMTAAEYARWLAEHQRALQGRSHTLASAYVQRLQGLVAGGYALGWQCTQILGRGALVHSGADKGFMGLVVLAQDGSSSHFAISNTLSAQADGSSWVLRSHEQTSLGYFAHPPRGADDVCRRPGGALNDGLLAAMAR